VQAPSLAANEVADLPEIAYGEDRHGLAACALDSLAQMPLDAVARHGDAFKRDAEAHDVADIGLSDRHDAGCSTKFDRRPGGVAQGLLQPPGLKRRLDDDIVKVLEPFATAAPAGERERVGLGLEDEHDPVDQQDRIGLIFLTGRVFPYNRAHRLTLREHGLQCRGHHIFKGIAAGLAKQLAGLPRDVASQLGKDIKLRGEERARSRTSGHHA
jgi:hypothetical protein